MRSWRGVNQRFRIFVSGRFRGVRWAATLIDWAEKTGWARLSAPLHRFGYLLDAGLKSGAYIGFAALIGTASVLFGLWFGLWLGELVEVFQEDAQLGVDCDF